MPEMPETFNSDLSQEQREMAWKTLLLLIQTPKLVDQLVRSLSEEKLESEVVEWKD